MATPESLIEAFGRGLMQGAMASEGKTREKKERPAVIKKDDVDRAVKQYVESLAQDESPSARELDLFTTGIEHDEPEDVTNARLDLIAAAHERASRNGQVEQEGVFDANIGGTPWTSPVQ